MIANSKVKPKGEVEIYVMKGNETIEIYKKNTVTDAGKNLLASFLMDNNVQGIKNLAVIDANGEFSRHLPTNVELVDNSKVRFTFYLNENDALTTITGFKLCADTADLTLNTGIYYASVDYNREKTSTESMLIHWHCEVI